MKIQLLIVLAIVFISRIYSQDTTMIHSEIPEDSIVYKHNYYSIFQNDSDVKQLLYIGLKGPALSPDNRIGDYLFFLDEIVFERRIFNQFSLNAGVYNLNSPLYSQQQQDYYGTSLLLKYFIPTVQDRRAKKTKTNLTGPYVAAGYRNYFKTSNSVDNSNGYLSGVAFQLGWQNRVFKYSYFNVVLNASLLYGDQLQVPSAHHDFLGGKIYFNPEVKFGAVIGNSKENYQACRILNCQQDRKHLFKINVLDLLRNRYSRHGISLEYEQKLGDGPWSINGGISVNYGFYKSSFEWEGILNPKIHNIYVSGFIEPRYYHNLKRRMLKGISGNGFSANFIGLELSSNHWNFLIRGETEKASLISNSRILYANYSIQREVGRNLFCQFRTGIQYNFEGFSPALDIKLGFAF
ncbi:MAG: hypothetical protein IPI60_17415 [Saprospiraceae bacterium]|nr:hypothetical protein [Saprospiraceae bacterium]